MTMVCSVSIDEQIKEVRREIKLREWVYPRWIENGKLSEQKANEQLQIMKAVLATLLEIQKKDKHQATLF